LSEVEIHRSFCGYVFDLVFLGTLGAGGAWLHLIVMANGGYLNFDPVILRNFYKLAPVLSLFLIGQYVLTLPLPRFRLEASEYHITSVGGRASRYLHELKNITVYSNGFFVVRYRSGRRVWYHKCLFIDSDTFIDGMSDRGVTIIQAD
jgi:hypothetical protein